MKWLILALPFLADVSVDLTSSMIIPPLTILQIDVENEIYRVRPSLQYLPSMNCLAYLTKPNHLNFVHDSNSQHSIHIHQAKNELMPSVFALHLESTMLALGVPFVYFNYEHRIPTHIQLVKLPENPRNCEVHEIPSLLTKFVKPTMDECRINKLKFFPDGSKLIVIYSNEKNESWCKIFTLPKSLDDEGNFLLYVFLLYFLTFAIMSVIVCRQVYNDFSSKICRTSNQQSCSLN